MGEEPHLIGFSPGGRHFVQMDEPKEIALLVLSTPVAVRTERYGLSIGKRRHLTEAGLERAKLDSHGRSKG